MAIQSSVEASDAQNISKKAQASAKDAKSSARLTQPSGNCQHRMNSISFPPQTRQGFGFEATHSAWH
jgi:hypothetical protein